jgi:hypothetical protein
MSDVIAKNKKQKDQRMRRTSTLGNNTASLVRRSSQIRNTLVRRRYHVVVFDKCDVGATDVVAKSPRNTEFEQSAATRCLVESSLHQNFMFANLADEEVQGVIDEMKPTDVVEGQHVIEQHGTGDNFYVVETGLFNICIDGETVAKAKSGSRYD